MRRTNRILKHMIKDHPKVPDISGLKSQVVSWYRLKFCISPISSTEKIDVLYEGGLSEEWSLNTGLTVLLIPQNLNDRKHFQVYGIVKLVVGCYEGHSSLSRFNLSLVLKKLKGYNISLKYMHDISCTEHISWIKFIVVNLYIQMTQTCDIRPPLELK